ncbi:MAG TPA: poly-gamma-glutamate hydrolase family protein [Acidimicrobiales bacterium]|nr:poly-gamma-glutamate hydrolase family protein [Acidimicrobiales bacterium]
MGRFAELLASDGVEEDLELRSTFGFLAFHGGNLEAGTDVIAAAAAEAAGASLYAVRQPDTLRWHIPSIEVTPDESPALAAFLDHVAVAVAVHGYGRDGWWTRLLLGGRNRDLARHVGGHLREALPDYEVVDELEEIPPELRGVHRANPVNRCPAAGVQLELPPRVRQWTPFWADLPAGEPIPHTADVVAALAAAARTWSAPIPRVAG